MGELRIDNRLDVGDELQISQRPVESPFDAWKKNPNPDTGAALFKDLQPHIESATRRHAGDTSAVNIGRAKSILIDALPRYDGRSSMATFVDRQLLPMKRWSAKHRVGVRMPTSFAVQAKQLSEREIELEDQLGRPPSRAELADATGISLSRMAKLSRIRVPIVGERPTPARDDAGYSEAADQAIEDDRQLAVKSLYYSLNPVNQFILESTLGLNGARRLSNQEIARRLKISPGAVSQRKLKIQEQLDRS